MYSICCEYLVVKKKNKWICGKCNRFIEWITFKKKCQKCGKDYDSLNRFKSKYCGGCTIIVKSENAKRYKKKVV